VLVDVPNRRRLRTLADSDRRYATIVISRDARWIAAAARGDDRIDLWRADNGRHLAALKNDGPASRLEFSPDGRELRVHGKASGGLVFSVPGGEAIGGFHSANGGSAAPAPRVEVGEPRTGGLPPSVAAPSPRTFGSAPPKFAAPKTETFAPPRAPETTEQETMEPEATVAPPQASLKRHEFRMEEEPPAPRAAPPVESEPPLEAEPPEEERETPRMAVPRMAPSAAAPRMAPPLPPPPAAAPGWTGAGEPRSVTIDEHEPSGGSARETFGEVRSALPGAAAPGAPAPDFSAEPQPMNAPPVAADPVFEPAPTAADPAFEPAPTASAPPAGDEPAAADPGDAFSPSESDEAERDAMPEPTASEPTDAEPPIAEPTPAESAPAEPAPAAPTTSEPAAAEPTPAEPTAAARAVAPVIDPSKVAVHYATNRNRLAPKDREWLVYFKGFFSSVPAFVIYGLMLFAVLIFPWFGKRSWATYSLVTGLLVLCAMGTLEAYVRSQLRDELSGELFGARPTDVSYGVCEISVPPAKNRQPGEVNRPVSVWVFQAPENPDKHFILRKVEEHADKAAFLDSIQTQLDDSGTDAALVFIHGYNVSFEDAVFRTAQLAVDLKFPGAAVTFSWPSYADPVKYTFDEQNAEVSIPALRELLVDLAAKSGAKRLHVIAHSMGNRVLAGALKTMDHDAREINKRVIRELVLAAPDIDSRVFKSQVLPHIVQNTQHCTLYASSRDRALLISRYFHNYQRLGETEPDLIVADGMDTIDASFVDTSLLGHSYIGDVQSIVSDLHQLVVAGKRPLERLGLVALQRAGFPYWTIKPHLETASDDAVHR
jgi:esterase/lipase superfamily enzyme